MNFFEIGFEEGKKRVRGKELSGEHSNIKIVAALIYQRNRIFPITIAILL
jgi:hypothetical protein